MAKINKSELKSIIKEELLRLIKIGQLKELKGQLDEVRLYDSEESYDFGSYLSINRNDEAGLLNFDFAPPGWNFDTTDAAEAVAIIKGSQYKSDPKLKEIQLTDADKANVDPEQALYWITGGNKEWKFGELYNTTWDESYKIFVDAFGGTVKSIVVSSSNLGELIEKLANEIPIEDVYELASDKGLIDYEDEEVDSNDSIEPSQSLQEAKKFWQKEAKVKK